MCSLLHVRARRAPTFLQFWAVKIGRSLGIEFGDHDLCFSTLTRARLKVLEAHSLNQTGSCLPPSGLMAAFICDCLCGLPSAVLGSDVYWHHLRLRAHETRRGRMPVTRASGHSYARVRSFDLRASCITDCPLTIRCDDMGDRQGWREDAPGSAELRQ